MTKVVGVRFRQVGKIYFFAPGQYNVEVGQHVIVETARGIEYGHVVLGEREVEDSAVVQPLKAIIRISTPDDDEREAKNREKEKEPRRDRAQGRSCCGPLVSEAGLQAAGTQLPHPDG